jgi:hypothetical protein
LIATTPSAVTAANASNLIFIQFTPFITLNA